MKKGVKYFFISAGIFAGVIFIAFLVFLYSFYKSIETVRDPDKYQSILEKWGDSPLVAHFPKKISNNDKIIAFSFYPGFLQGGSHIQIRLSVSKQSLSKMFDDFQKFALEFYDGGNKYELRNSQKGKLVGTSFFTSTNDTRIFPEDYRIFIIDAKPYQEDSWNHGYSYGAVVSLKRQEIIYYAEDW